MFGFFAPLLADRVKETSTTTGTGTLTLAGAATGFQTFVAGIGDGSYCVYCIKHQSADEWEVGIGKVTDAGSDTLTRETVIQSTNSDGLVSFSAGTKDVWITLPADLAGRGELRNLIRNPAFRLYHRNVIGSSYPGGDAAYTFDHWIILGAAGTPTGVVNTSGAGIFATVKSSDASAKVGLCQILDHRDTLNLAGKWVTLSADLKIAGALGSDVRMAVIERTSAWDGSDPISAWGTAGTNPTLASGWSYIGTPASLSLTTSFVRKVKQAQLGGSMYQIGVIFWSEDTSYDELADWFDIRDVQLEPGRVPSEFQSLPMVLEAAAAAGKWIDSFEVTDAFFPSSNFAVHDTRNTHRVLAYDDTTEETAYFERTMPRSWNRYGEGLTFDLYWAAASATTGNAVVEIALERIGEGALDIDGDSFGTVAQVVSAAPGTTGYYQKATIHLTSSGELDSLKAGERYRLRVRRKPSDGSDNMSGDLQLVGVVMREKSLLN